MNQPRLFHKQKNNQQKLHTFTDERLMHHKMFCHYIGQKGEKRAHFIAMYHVPYVQRSFATHPQTQHVPFRFDDNILYLCHVAFFVAFTHSDLLFRA